MLLELATQPGERRRAQATHAVASNKLAQAAIVDLPAAGEWTLTVTVRANGETAQVTACCRLPRQHRE